MLNTNITNFLKNIFELLEQTIKYNAGEYQHKGRKCRHNQRGRLQRLDGNGISFIYSATARADYRRPAYTA